MTVPSRSLAWPLWAVALAGLYTVLLGRQTLDAVDGYYPTRNEVRRRSAPEPVSLTIAPGARESSEIVEALAVLPPALVALVARRRASLIVTTLEDIERRGIQPGDPMLHVAGYFSEDDWELHIAHDGERPGHTALHEYGHFVDAALGRCSRTSTFLSLFHRAGERAELSPYYLEVPQELFAHVFAEYYFSDRRRERLAERYPDSFAYMQKLEASARCPQ